MNTEIKKITVQLSNGVNFAFTDRGFDFEYSGDGKELLLHRKRNGNINSNQSARIRITEPVLH